MTITCLYYSGIKFATRRLKSWFDCLLHSLFRLTTKETSRCRLRVFVWGIHAPVTGGFPSHRASNAERVSITSSWDRKKHGVQFTKKINDNIDNDNKMKTIANNATNMAKLLHILLMYHVTKQPLMALLSRYHIKLMKLQKLLVAKWRHVVT